MRTLALTLALAFGMAAEAPARRGNTFELVFPEGHGEIEWVSGSTFRLTRAWQERIERRPAVTAEAVPLSASETAAGYRFEARYLTVEIDRAGRVVKISEGRGKPLVEWHIEKGTLGAAMQPKERLYGLHASGAATLDLRGIKVETRKPFLLSSAGYGEYYPRAGTYRCDLSGPRRIAMPGEGVEAVFYYGPVPSAIFEEHAKVVGAIDPFGAAEFRVRPRQPAGGGTWDSLRERLRELVAASLSADLVPEFDLGAWIGGDAKLEARATQIAALMPVLYAPPGAHGFERLRNRLAPYLLSYTKDARDRGGPVLRPLAWKDPEDPEAGRVDEFMLGDELLVAPGLDPGDEREVYLPRGLWTELASGKVSKGRQRIRVRIGEDGPPMFARNGTIVPLQPAEPGAPLELHYFPSLGAEFFLFEDGLDDISQIHAGPADDVLRLEIESLVARKYEWVIGGRRLRVDVKPGEDSIVNIPLGDLSH